MVELSETLAEKTQEQVTPSAPPAVVQEPRQSEEVRRVQAAKDAEIARIRREGESVKQELESLRAYTEQLTANLQQSQIQSLPDETARQYFSASQAQDQQRRLLTRLQQRAALAEARLEHKDVEFSDDDLQSLARGSRNEADFKSQVAKAAESKRQAGKEADALRAKIRQEVEEEVRQQATADRIATSTPGTPRPSEEADYRRQYDEAVKTGNPQLIIQARRNLEAQRLRK